MMRYIFKEFNGIKQIVDRHAMMAGDNSQPMTAEDILDVLNKSDEILRRHYANIKAFHNDAEKFLANMRDYDK